MGRALVSPEMWNCHWLVVGLRDRIGDRIVKTTGSVPSGYLKADTTDSPNNRGFSLRVNRRNDADPTTSIMAITNRNADHWLIFPSRRALYCFLPDLHAEVDEYMAVINRLRPDVDVDDHPASTIPRLLHLGEIRNVVRRELDELARCAQALAGPC